MTVKELNTGEPVAWMFVLDGCRCVMLDEDVADEVRYNGTPLYTHPVKELTDEEILEELLIPKSEWDSYKAHHCLKQIRAILRKEQEK